MIIGFEGGLGSGKTVGMVRYIKQDYDDGVPIMSNMPLYDIEYQPLIMENLLNDEKGDCELYDVTICIDEITVYADCRLSTTKGNRIFSYFVLQTRKKNVDLYYTTQDFDMVDLRLYNHTHIQVICEMIFPDEEPDLAVKYGIDKKHGCIKDVRRYCIIDIRNRAKPKINRIIVRISDYYDMYDTDKTISPI